MGSVHDFDFLVGKFDSVHRRLVKPLTGRDEWDEFPGRTVARPLFGGTANMDEIEFPTRGWGGATIRLYNEATDEWSLHWISSRRTDIDHPMIGRFDDTGRGEFYADDTYDGQSIKVRYLWLNVHADGARWEQAFSIDDGATWETNWEMDFTRTA
jgi:hypothetical protein